MEDSAGAAGTGCGDDGSSCLCSFASSSPRWMEANGESMALSMISYTGQDSKYVTPEWQRGMRRKSARLVKLTPPH